jgi:flavodoxin
MKVLIVFDSFFGNTEQIAHAISNSFAANYIVEACRVSEFELEHLNGLQLLIVGSPTRGFKFSTATKDFFAKIPANGLKGIKVAAFDTRISPMDANSRVYNLLSKTFGYAAEPIAKMLVKKGGEMIIPPAGFIVKDTEGPLKEGELERAASWLKVADS